MHSRQAQGSGGVKTQGLTNEIHSRQTNQPHLAAQSWQLQKVGSKFNYSFNMAAISVRLSSWPMQSIWPPNWANDDIFTYWPMTHWSSGCHLDRCFQYGRQLNQRWHIHILAYDPLVTRLSSWPMLSIWPPTEPTMTYSYIGLWPIGHQAVILTDAVNMAANWANDDILTYWPMTHWSSGCHVEQCCQYGRQINQQWRIMAFIACNSQARKNCQRLDKLWNTRAVFNAQESPESSLVNVIPHQTHTFFSQCISPRRSSPGGPATGGPGGPAPAPGHWHSLCCFFRAAMASAMSGTGQPSRSYQTSYRFRSPDGRPQMGWRWWTVAGSKFQEASSTSSFFWGATILVVAVATPCPRPRPAPRQPRLSWSCTASWRPW